MSAIFPVIVGVWKELCIWLVAFAIVFTLLSRIHACNPGQPILRQGLTTDLLYCFIMPILNRIVRAMFIGAGIYVIFYGHSQASIQDYIMHGYGPLASMPIWWQAAVIFLLSDFILYWTHRGFHEQSMWRFHAIHHSPVHVDWLSTFRFHPVNTWLSFTLVDSMMMLVGFSPAAVAAMASVNLIYSAMVHANLSWTFGPFKYLFASPVFHRWHHTAREEGMNKNFAPTFPLIDIIFGTFYMPEGRLPDHYGVAGSDIPEDFFKQMVWPFKKRQS
jgi:sterol desaturase/sphingolipid hydroxylase (fatty acid hydroxylase superfamily)